jgi:adenylosuccinate synthase
MYFLMQNVGDGPFTVLEVFDDEDEQLLAAVVHEYGGLTNRLTVLHMDVEV